MTHDLEARMRFAIDLARRAGELGLRYFRDLDSLTVESKGHQDLVSQADREVELFIRAAIAADYP
ncbi:inositol monophosphatase, partial [Mesorhizobium sp. M8A.F.Ca.ET.023.01.1.1]